MIDFYEQHRSERFRFEIVAFHDESVKTFDELDPQMTKFEKEHWKGRKLPFPILLDASGTTLRQYGVRLFPTTILIDPDGRLVGRCGLEDLAGRLSREAGTSRPSSAR